MKMLRITIEGKSYDVAVEVLDANTTVAPAASAPATPVAAPVAPAATPAPVSAGAGDSVKSPMAGMAMKIKVKVGDSVKKDQEVMVLEAMKMETPVFAPCDGTVSAILVKEGDAVAEDQVLVQIG